MAAISTITPNFSDTSLWTPLDANLVAQGTKHTHIAATSLTTTVGYDLTNDSFSFKVQQHMLGNTQTIEFRDANGVANYYRFVKSGTAGSVWTAQITGVAINTWTEAVALAEPYFRIRHTSSGTPTVHFETSADQVTWTSRASTTTIITLTNIYVKYNSNAGTTTQPLIIQEQNGVWPQPAQTIALRVAGTPTAATAAVTALSPASGAGLLPSDISILYVQVKGASAGVAPAISTPAGWTLISHTNNGTLVAGADTGSNTVAVYYQVGYPASTATGNLTITGGDSGSAVIHSYSTAKGLWSVPTSTTGSDTSSGANASITGAGSLDVQLGDWVSVCAGISGDLGTVTAETIGGMSGATLDTLVERTNFDVTTSNDSAQLVYDRRVVYGSSTSAPTTTWTNASSTTAHAAFISLRDYYGPRKPRMINQTLSRSVNF